MGCGEGHQHEVLCVNAIDHNSNKYYTFRSQRSGLCVLSVPSVYMRVLWVIWVFERESVMLCAQYASYDECLALNSDGVLSAEV